jgi:RHS repeat-associated protein
VAFNNYQYDEWGNILESNETVNNPFKYAGEVYDQETELYYLNSRYYDPSLGRFINEDTYEGQINNPLSLNVYTYCYNNPLIYTDPTGHIPWTSFSDFKSDWAGRAILWGWLYGGGDAMIIKDNKKWTKYMENNNILTNKVQSLGRDYAAQVDYGKTKAFDITTSMIIENGEQVIGYQYLHGTDYDAGGFRIKGTITKDKYGNATVKFTYQWNDTIDPNFMYKSDSKKAKFAKSIPFAKPTNYKLSISWTDTSVLNNDGIFISGWLSKGEPSIKKNPNSSSGGNRK